MHMVPARAAWEVPVASDALIGSALSSGRPTALAHGEPRLDGLSDAAVAERYHALRALVWASADGDATVLERLQNLERSDIETSWTRWQMSVTRSDVDDDAEVVEAARAVWEALGPNAYAVQFRHRPRRFRGFLEGRTWLQLGALGCVGLAFAAFSVDERFAVPWWLWLPLIAGWPVLVWRMFYRSYERRRAVGGKQLPHF